VAVDPGKCEGWLGDLCCIEDEPIESIEGIISLFLQFGRWENSVIQDDEFSFDARERFRDDCRRCRFLLFACNGGERLFIVFSCCSNVCSPGEIVSGWFMRAWGGWCICVLSGGACGGPSPFGVVAGWFIGGWGSGMLLARTMEFGGDGGHLFFQFADSVCAGSL
jgi:hypothetical protein